MKIQVREEHIKNGQPENCERCAVALAVKDSLKADSVSVTTDCDENIEISAWFDKLGYKEQKDISIMDSDQIQVNYFVELFDSYYDWDGNQSVYNSVSHSGKLLKVSNNNKNVSYDKGLKPFEFEVNYG